MRVFVLWDFFWWFFWGVVNNFSYCFLIIVLWLLGVDVMVLFCWMMLGNKVNCGKLEMLWVLLERGVFWLLGFGVVKCDERFVVMELRDEFLLVFKWLYEFFILILMDDFKDVIDNGVVIIFWYIGLDFILFSLCFNWEF